jgi:U4/U6.U5 tri-snRNP-associated protein 2
MVYDLLSNITLDTTVASTTAGQASGKRDPSEEGVTTWKIHQRCGRGGGDHEKWFEMQDLRDTRTTTPSYPASHITSISNVYT